MGCTKINCPMQAGTTTDRCGDNCPWRTTAKKGDLISRAAAIAEIEEYIEEYSDLEPETGYHNLKWCAMEEAKDVLSMLPAVDAVPVVHGQWIKSEDGDGIVCTACGEDYCDMVVGCNPKEWKFCPACGARMSEG